MPSLILMIFSEHIKALNPGEGDIVTAEDLGIQGTDCNCPNDCQETVYTQEMSQAELRKDSRFFKKLSDQYQARWIIENTIEKVK